MALMSLTRYVKSLTDIDLIYYSKNERFNGMKDCSEKDFESIFGSVAIEKYLKMIETDLDESLDSSLSIDKNIDLCDTNALSNTLVKDIHSKQILHDNLNELLLYESPASTKKLRLLDCCIPESEKTKIEMDIDNFQRYDLYDFFKNNDNSDYFSLNLGSIFGSDLMRMILNIEMRSSSVNDYPCECIEFRGNIIDNNDLYRFNAFLKEKILNFMEEVNEMKDDLNRPDLYMYVYESNETYINPYEIQLTGTSVEKIYDNSFDIKSNRYRKIINEKLKKFIYDLAYELDDSKPEIKWNYLPFAVTSRRPSSNSFEITESDSLYAYLCSY